MEGWEIRQLGYILAEFTRGLGMISENMQRQTLGHSMAYDAEAFEGIASSIEAFSRDL